MAQEVEKIIQRLGLIFETDEQSKETVLRSLEEVNDKAKKFKENLGDASVEASKLGEVFKKDIAGVFDKLSPALGELSSLAKVAGPLTALATGFILIRDRMADLESVAINVNRQFSGFRETMVDIASLQRELNFLGFNKEQGNNIITQMSRVGGLTNEEQLNQAVITTGAAAKRTGMDPTEVGNIVAAAIKTGALDPNNIAGGMFGQGGKQGILPDIIEKHAEAGMTVSSYSKALFELWNVTKNYNISFDTTQKLLVNWGEELEKGVVSLRDVADLATGSKMSDSQKLFMAQQLQKADPSLGLTGSPLEMLTKFEHKLLDPAFQEKLGSTIFKMADEKSKSPEEMVQWVKMLNQTLLGGAIPGLDTLRGTVSFLEKAAPTDQKGKFEAAFPEVAEDMNVQLKKALDKQNAITQAKEDASRVSDIEKVKSQLGIDTLMSTGTLGIGKMLVDQAFSGAAAAADPLRNMKEQIRQAEKAAGSSRNFGNAIRGFDKLPEEEQENFMNKFANRSGGGGKIKIEPVEVNNNLTVTVKAGGQTVGTKNFKGKKSGHQKFDLPSFSSDLPGGGKLTIEE